MAAICRPACVPLDYNCETAWHLGQNGEAEESVASVHRVLTSRSKELLTTGPKAV